MNPEEDLAFRRPSAPELAAELNDLVWKLLRRDEITFKEVEVVLDAIHTVESQCKAQPGSGTIGTMEDTEMTNALIFAFHNVVAHPVSGVLRLLGLRRAATWVHDESLFRGSK